MRRAYEGGGLPSGVGACGWCVGSLCGAPGLCVKGVAGLCVKGGAGPHLLEVGHHVPRRHHVAEGLHHEEGPEHAHLRHRREAVLRAQGVCVCVQAPGASKQASRRTASLRSFRFIGSTTEHTTPTTRACLV